MRFDFNLKHGFPFIAAGAALIGLVFFSFRHDFRQDPGKEAQRIDSKLPASDVNLSHAILISTQAHPVPVPAPSSAPGATSRDLAQARVFDEILVAKNDNDPRMDTDLRQLSPAAKRLLAERYARILPEKRNERGTAVFVIGRELSSAEDLGFLHQVLLEPPCRSLADCEREETGSVSAEDRHHEGPSEVTLAYPQIVALKALESYLASAGRKPELETSALAELEAAKASPIRKVAALAEEILARRRSQAPSR